jgi:hypothetical protein
MKKTAISIALGAALSLGSLPAGAAWFGTPGFAMRNGRSSIQAVYDTGTRSIEPKNGGNDIDMDTNRFYIEYARGFGNGLDLFGRFMPETGDASFENSNYNPSLLGFGGGVHWAPAQSGPVHWGGQVSLDLDSGKDQGTKLNVTEIALAGGGSYRANNNLDVYAGASLMRSDISVKNGGTQKFELSNTFGLYGGLGFLPTPNVTLGFELHLINETVFGFSGSYRFGGEASAPRRARSRGRRR